MSEPNKQRIVWSAFTACAIAAFALSGGLLEAQPTSNADTVELSLPLSPETIPGVQENPTTTALVVMGHEGDHPTTRPIRPAADTYIWKGNNKPVGTAGGVLVRDGRFSQGLFRFDLAGLDKSMTVKRASFRFKAGASERPGNVTLKFHRMLVNWSEAATWDQPQPDRPEMWAGPRPGKEFEAEPFATYDVEQWKPGMIEIAGFEKAIAAWREGTWPNHGFVVELSGKALQVNIPSREAAPAPSPQTFLLGGPDVRTAVLHVNLPLLRRALVGPDDLRRASLKLKLKGKPSEWAGLTLWLYAAKTGGGFEDQPMYSAALSQVDTKGIVEISGVIDLLKTAWTADDLPLRVTVSGTSRTGIQLFGAASPVAARPTLSITLKAYTPASLYDFALRPIQGTYCTIKDGHLFYGGQRLRLWGEVGYGAADRKRQMGFNCDRLWGGPDLYDDASVRRGQFKGDAPGAAPDKFDAQFAAIKRQGMFIMYAGLTGTIPLDKYRKPLLADDSFLAATGGDDWAAWKAAVSTKVDQNPLAIFDERLAALRFAHARNLLNHVNPLTGRKLGEDEAVVIYEVWNELGFVRWVMEGGLDKAPAYFREKARRKWNGWLAHRYKTDAALGDAWGKLGADESLAAASIKFGPVLAQRKDYPEARARDFVRFIIEMLNDFNQRFREHCRAQAPQGIGVNACPFSFDTQYRPNIPWVYTNSLGDVNCFGMYFWGIVEELAKPPSLYVIDSHAVERMPTVLYETNQARPSRYRSDYPQRVAAFASWQDFDGVIFHYWGGLTEEGTPGEAYMVQAMPHVNRSHYWSGVQHAFDPVMCSSMAIAGRMFLGNAVAPAPHPAVYDVGAQGIFGFDLYNGVGMAQVAFARGARLRFDPQEQSTVSVYGREPPAPERPKGAVFCGKEVVWDWPNGRMIIDTPTYKAYVGRVAGAYRFSDGIALSDVSVPWVCFTLASADGKPLAGPDASRRMLVWAGFDARNTGFEMDPAFHGGGPLETSDAIRNRGTALVRVDPVGYTLSFPTKVSGRFEGYDFALRRITGQSLADTSTVVREPRDIYMGVLTLERRGDLAPTPGTTLALSTGQAAPAQSAPSPAKPAPADLSDPIPGVKWGQNAAQVDAALRKSTLAFTSIDRIDPDKPEARVTLSDARVLWDTPTDVVFSFKDGTLHEIRLTFKQPPPLNEAVAAFEKQLGPPLEKKLARQEEVSRARWSVRQGGCSLEVIVTEAQGTLGVSYRLLPK